MASHKPADYKALRQALLTDLDTLHTLTLRYAAGDVAVKQERDRLEQKSLTNLGLLLKMRASLAKP